nr:MAG TPA: hypothetical protein [Crassvirales sp.]
MIRKNSCQLCINSIKIFIININGFYIRIYKISYYIIIFLHNILRIFHIITNSLRCFYSCNILELIIIFNLYRNKINSNISGIYTIIC